MHTVFLPAGLRAGTPTPTPALTEHLLCLLERADCCAKQLNRGSLDTKPNYLILLSSFKLTTCFGLSLGHLQVTGYINEETIQCES